jgi:hypothetical protein
MPSPATLDAFLATVEAGDYVGAIERFYSPDASMQENADEPRVGRDLLVKVEQAAMARVDRIVAHRAHPPLVAGDQVAIRWRFEFVVEGKVVSTLEEIAWQTWRGEEIAHETFFYDPVQMKV